MSLFMLTKTGTNKMTNNFIDKEWEKEFDEATFRQNNEGNPYFPDWEEVRLFIREQIQRAEKRGYAKGVKDTVIAGMNAEPKY